MKHSQGTCTQAPLGIYYFGVRLLVWCTLDLLSEFVDPIICAKIRGCRSTLRRRGGGKGLISDLIFGGGGGGAENTFSY